MTTTTVKILNYDGSVDRIFSTERPKRIGVQLTELLTDQVYKRLDEIDPKNQRVQTTQWDKYELQMVGIEDYAPDLLLVAKSIQVVSYDNTQVHDAVIISIDRQRVSDSDFTHWVIEYYDRNLGNYKYGQPPVTDFLRSDVIAQRVPFSQRNVLRLNSGGNVYDFSSMLEFTLQGNTPERSQFTNLKDGYTVTTNSIIKSQAQTIFYLNQVDMLNFSTLVPLADGAGTVAILYTGSNSYRIKEVPDVAIQKIGGWDIYLCTAAFTYSAINNYSYGI